MIIKSIYKSFLLHYFSCAIVCLLNKTQLMLFFAIHAKQSYETYEPEMSFSQYKVWFCHSLKALQVL